MSKPLLLSVSVLLAILNLGYASEAPAFKSKLFESGNLLISDDFDQEKYKGRYGPNKKNVKQLADGTLEVLPLSGTFSPLTDPEELLLIEGLDEPMERLKLRDQDTNMILDMIQMITGRHILRPQNLPAVKVTFDSISILTKRETLLAVESLLAMNGIGITKIDDRFYKAVPASGMNIHVPIWLDAPASTLRPSQRIYMKMFKLNYAPALEVREQLNAFATPNVGSLLLFEKSNSIMITDSLLNLQRMEEIIEKIDKPVRPEDLNVLIIDKPLKNSDAKTVKAKLDGMIQNSLKPFLGGTTAVEIDERTNSIIVITKAENNATITRFLDFLDKELENENRDEEVFQLKHADATEIHRILIEPSPISMMPQGLVNTMSKDDILDLLAYYISGGDPESSSFKN